MHHTIWAALIALVGSILVALLANWEKLPWGAKRSHGEGAPQGGGSSGFAHARSKQEMGAPRSDAARTALALTQLRLSSAGYRVATDGLLGAQTTDALIKFQGDSGLPVTGIVDPPTNAALVLRQEEFKSVQSLLIAAGYSVGVDGLCGRNTILALKDLQQKHGLSVTGVADQATRHLLQTLTAPNFRL